MSLFQCENCGCVENTALSSQGFNGFFENYTTGHMHLKGKVNDYVQRVVPLNTKMEKIPNTVNGITFSRVSIYHWVSLKRIVRVIWNMLKRVKQIINLTYLNRMVTGKTNPSVNKKAGPTTPLSLLTHHIFIHHQNNIIRHIIYIAMRIV